MSFLCQYILFVLEKNEEVEREYFPCLIENHNEGTYSCEKKAIFKDDQQIITTLESHEENIPTQSFEKDVTVKGMYSKH